MNPRGDMTVPTRDQLRLIVQGLLETPFGAQAQVALDTTDLWGSPRGGRRPVPVHELLGIWGARLRNPGLPDDLRGQISALVHALGQRPEEAWSIHSFPAGDRRFVVFTTPAQSARACLTLEARHDDEPSGG